MIRVYALALLSIIAMVFGAAMLSGTTAPEPAENASIGVPGAHSVDVMTEDGPTVIKRDGSGQFYIRGDVNGQNTRFLVDTGADMVALSVDEAEQLGIEFDPSTFEAITQTASGPGFGQHVTIERLDLAGQELENVSAVVIDGLEVNLLGQSVLRRLGRIELHGDQLVIGKSG